MSDVNFPMTSPEISELISAVIKLQQVVELPKRTKLNDHSFTRFAPLHVIISLIKDPLAVNGLALNHFRTPMFITNADGIRLLREVLVTQLSHTSGQWMRAYTVLRRVTGSSDESALGINSAETLARRTNIKALLNLAEVDDDDDGQAFSTDEDDGLPLAPLETEPAESEPAALSSPSAGASNPMKELYDAFNRMFDEFMANGQTVMLQLFIKNRLSGDYAKLATEKLNAAIALKSSTSSQPPAAA